MKAVKEQRFTLRIPLITYRRLQAVQRIRPHLSMNALIVEAISRDIGSKERDGLLVKEPRA